MQVSVGHDIDGTSHRVGANGNEKFIPFDLEVKSSVEADSSGNAFGDSKTAHNYEFPEAKFQHSHLLL